MNVEVRGHLSAVEIEVTGYENANARDTDDANWLICIIRLCIGGISGQLSASFTTHDFVGFLTELGGALAAQGGTATFQTYEEALSLTIELKRSGSAQISGAARSIDMPRVELLFSFESDQSYLTQTYNQLLLIAREFPVRT